RSGQQSALEERAVTIEQDQIGAIEHHNGITEPADRWLTNLSRSIADGSEENSPTRSVACREVEKPPGNDTAVADYDRPVRGQCHPHHLFDGREVVLLGLDGTQRHQLPSRSTVIPSSRPG